MNKYDAFKSYFKYQKLLIIYKKYLKSKKYFKSKNYFKIH